MPFLHHACGTLTHADKGEQRRIRANADHNREYFRSKYGCYPGTKAYEALFTEAGPGASLPQAEREGQPAQASEPASS